MVMEITVREMLENENVYRLPVTYYNEEEFVVHVILIGVISIQLTSE
jgi:hypothetical protein